ncbi:hypothetical protein [Paraburkholderia hospita]|nr:hypothetical protein [Paraburkholderia hospita]
MLDSPGKPDFIALQNAFDRRGTAKARLNDRVPEAPDLDDVIRINEVID